MRFLHTADWHLGRLFHGVSLLDAQAEHLAWLRDVAMEASVDAVLVSGDLYDRALPPVDAVSLASEALSALTDVCPVVVISGNHDSATRLSFGAGLLERAGLHVRTEVARIGEPVLFDGWAVYPIPYLEPDVVRLELGVAERGHGPVLAAAMQCVRDDIALRSPTLKTVVMAHAFVSGAACSESERDLSVGGSATVAPSVFNGVGYVALGHMHAPQELSWRSRYSGSPLAYSFSEAGHEKSVAVVDLAGERPAVELLACPVPRRLAVLRGELASLLEDPALAWAEDCWVQVALTDPLRPAEAMDRIRARFPHAVVLTFEPVGAVEGPARSYAARVRGLDDRQLVSAFVEDVRGSAPTEDEDELLDEALAAARIAAAREVAA